MSLLSARQVCKRYGATYALDSVDFDVHAGAVNVLIGENGAGKSTLMRILAGIEQADDGQILFDDQPVQFSSVNDASARGIRIVHQELNLCPNLSVSDNIFLGTDLLRGPLVDRAAERARTRELLQAFNLDFDPETLVKDLRVGQQQMVEICKALLREAQVLILDEPTSALSTAEVKLLFALIRDLKAKGIGIVYISHRLEELLQIGDYITVLRDGKLQAATTIAGASIAWITSQMLGDSEQSIAVRRPSPVGETCLTVDGLRVKHRGGGYLLDDINLAFRRCEVTAIYGLLGSGRTELFESLIGLQPTDRGSILLDGKKLDGLQVAQRIRCGIFLVSEDRKCEGLLPNLSVAENLSASMLASRQLLSPIRYSSLNAVVQELAARLDVKTHSLDSSINSLSGGNQQKVMLGRCMSGKPTALLIDEPSRGVDVGARTEIFDQIQKLATQGATVLYATSDLHEALQFSDRVVVMANGSITGQFISQQTTEAELVMACNTSTTNPRTGTD